MTDLESRNFFTDKDLVANPYEYFDHLRSRCPVHPEPHHDVMMITGYAEATEVYYDNDGFSACNAVSGPFPGFPVPLEGDDIGELIAEHRDKLPMSDQLPHHGPPRPHRPPGSAHAAHHPQAPERERGVHVAPCRPPTRHVSLRRAAASSSRISPSRSPC